MIFFDCAAPWLNRAISLHQKQKSKDMKNTDYTPEQLDAIISTETGFDALLEIISDLDLQVIGVTQG